AFSPVKAGVRRRACQSRACAPTNARRLCWRAGWAGGGVSSGSARTVTTPSEPPLPSQGEGPRQTLAAEAAPAVRGSERRVVVRRGGLPGGGLFRCLFRGGFLRRLPGGLLRDFLRRLPGGLLRRCLLRRRLLRRRLLADAAAHGLAGLLHQPAHFLQRQRGRFAVLGDAAVEAAVADVGAVAAVEDLDVAALELLDDAVAGDLFLFLDQE